MEPYTLRVLFALLLGGGYLWLTANRQQFPRNQLAELLFCSLVGALVGGRIGYIAEHSTYFMENLVAALQPWRASGLQSSGAWVGGLAAVFFWGKLAGRSVVSTLFFLTPAVLLVAAGVWWGCAGALCAWGRVALTPPAWLQWAVVDAPDLYHTVLPRYAVQSLGVVWSLVLALGASVWTRGRLFLLSLYMLGDALLAAFRADPVLLLGPFRLDMVLSLVMAISFLWVQLWTIKLNRRHQTVL